MRRSRPEKGDKKERGGRAGSREGKPERSFKSSPRGGRDNNKKPFSRSSGSEGERSPRSERPYRSADSDKEGGFKKRSFPRSSEGERSRSSRPERSSRSRGSDGEGEFKKRPYPSSEGGRGRSERSDRPYKKPGSDSEGGFKKRSFSDRPGSKRPFERTDSETRPGRDRFRKEDGGDFKTEKRSYSKPGSRDAGFEGNREDRPFRRRPEGSEPFKRTTRDASERSAPGRTGDRGERRSTERRKPEDRSEGRPYERRRSDDTSEGRPSERRRSDDRSESRTSRFSKPGGSSRPFSKRGDGDAGFKKRVRTSERGNREGSEDPGNSSRSTKKSGDDGLIRLNKFISNSGICSRREADVLIQTGVISVNGKTITELGYKISPNDIIKYNGETIRREQSVYLLLNKPKDYITTLDDPEGRKTVFELIKNACNERIYPVGRLDRATTGVLLFTNDGELTRRLTHPKFGIKKLYHVQLDRPLAHEDLHKIREGVELEDGMIKVDEISFLEDGSDKRHVGVELHSGKNRIIRRLFEALNYDVVRLDRVGFAGLTKKDLPRGRWRFLSEKEVGFLKMISA